MFTREEIISAHSNSYHNRDEIKSSTRCGCFYCCDIFDADCVESYIDNEQTAICPGCGIDSVIGDASGYPITEEFLKAMKEQWF